MFNEHLWIGCRSVIDLQKETINKKCTKVNLYNNNNNNSNKLFVNLPPLLLGELKVSLLYIHNSNCLRLFFRTIKVQEVPSDEFQEGGVFLGPILRINCFETVQFSRSVTIQLPISLREQQVLLPDPTTCRVRVLFLESDDKQKEWIEITNDLEKPARFDGKFVRFQVERFSG